MRLQVEIPHDELSTPVLSASFALSDNGKGIVIDVSDALSQNKRLGRYVDDGYFISSDGRLYDSSRGPLRVLKSLVDSVDCKVLEGFSRICISAQHLDFAIELLSSCKGFEIKIDAGLQAIIAEKTAIHDTPLDLSLFDGQLYPHQEEAVRWLRSRLASGKGFALLADEQGLGKTVTVCAYLAADVYSRDRASTTLIVCPASIIPNWVDHLNKHLPSLRISVIAGQQKIRAKAIEDFDFDIAVTSAGRMRRDAGTISKVHLDCLIIDEATSVKGHSSKTRSAARKIQADRRIGLTGTPMPNSVKELHGIIGCLSSEGYLSTLESFNRRFVKPIENWGDIAASETLKMLISPCILRRLKADELDLPDKIESELYIDLPEDQLAIYEEFSSSLRKKLEVMSDEEFQTGHIGIIGAFTNLRQIAVSPAAVIPDYEGSAIKVRVATFMTQKFLAGSSHKVVIHTLFVRDVVQRIEHELASCGICSLSLIGSVPINERADIIKHFESDVGPRVLIISSAGGEGINLQSADIEIQLSPFFHHGTTDQAADRLHRIGQKKNVRIIKLIANNTIEQHMVELRNRKWDISLTVMRQHDRPLTKLTRSELLSLLD